MEQPGREQHQSYFLCYIAAYTSKYQGIKRDRDKQTDRQTERETLLTTSSASSLGQHVQTRGVHRLGKRRRTYRKINATLRRARYNIG